MAKRIEFHFNAPALVPYACRLLRKVQTRGLRAQVVGHSATLAQLDQALWTFAPLEFLTHCTTEAPAHMLQASAVLLAQAPRLDWHQEVLINLGEAVPQDIEAFERIIDVVTVDDLNRAQGRDRWRQYASLGHEMLRHDLLQSQA